MGFEAAKINNEQVKSDRVIIRKKLELLGNETMIATDDTAISVDLPVTYINTTTAGGAMAGLTLANGYEGQIKVVLLISDGGTATLTPANLLNGSYITFAEDYDVWVGIFHAGSWCSLVSETIAIG
jgi:hypothetical protein